MAAIRALRGATTLDVDTREHMHERVKALMHELFERNGLSVDDLISVLCTATPDLHSAYPAEAVRAFGLDDVPLMSFSECTVDGGLPRCVRVMVHVHSERSRAEMRHVYLEGAKGLRNDLTD